VSEGRLPEASVRLNVALLDDDGGGLNCFVLAHPVAPPHSEPASTVSYSSADTSSC
jgi:hypothetical protein